MDYVYFVPNLRAWYVESTLYPFIGGDTVEHADMERSGLQPSVNLILPYVYPEHLRQCGADAAYTFSRTCIENTLYIIEALETAYRRVYARNLTLRRLSEAVVLPLCPDKGRMTYNPPVPHSKDPPHRAYPPAEKFRWFRKCSSGLQSACLPAQ